MLFSLVILSCALSLHAYQLQQSVLTGQGPLEPWNRNVSHQARLDCPELNDLPVVNKGSNKFYGIRRYYDHGHEVPDLACNGDHYDDVDGNKWSAPDGQGYSFGTLFVHEGCSVYIFKDYNFGGDNIEFRGPQVVYDVPIHWDEYCVDDHTDCVRSYVVSCRMKMPNCVADDGWQTVGYLDNSDSTLDADYEYKHTVGTTWSEEMTDGFSVSTTVEETIKEGFFDIFEATLGISMTTGYDWSHTSSYAQEDVTERTVSVHVPAGDIIQIDQAYGTCGDSRVETEMLKTINARTGEVLGYIF